jgi:hypothetical protein
MTSVINDLEILSNPALFDLAFYQDEAIDLIGNNNRQAVIEMIAETLGIPIEFFIQSFDDRSIQIILAETKRNYSERYLTSPLLITINTFGITLYYSAGTTLGRIVTNLEIFGKPGIFTKFTLLGAQDGMNLLLAA